MAPSRPDRRPRAALTAGLCCAGLLGLTGCGGADATGRDEGAWRGEVTRSGDTTVVRTISGARWDGPREIAIDLEIGALDGRAELMFGSIDWIAPDAAGGVYVFDYLVPAIRHFDAAGRFLRPIGRDGEGPGEYSDMVTTGLVRSDGRLQIHDPALGRITVYEPAGEAAWSWPVPGGYFTAETMFIDARDHTYIKAPDRSGSSRRVVDLVEYDSEGTLADTVPEPPVAPEPEPSTGFLAARKTWTMAPDGALVVGVSDRYAFEVRRPDGTVLRVERAHVPRAVGDAEHAAYEERRRWFIENQGQFMARPPDVTPRIKPAWRALYAGRDGTIWVHLFGPVTPLDDVPPPEEGRPPTVPFLETHVFDVFAPDGAYLGRVRVPDGVTIHVFAVDELWGVRRGELDESYVVRMSLRPAAG